MADDKDRKDGKTPDRNPDHLAFPEPRKGPTSKQFAQSTDSDKQAEDRRFKTPAAKEDARTLRALADQALDEIDADHKEEMDAHRDRHDWTRPWPPEYAIAYNQKQNAMIEEHRRAREREKRDLEAGLTRIADEQHNVVLVRPPKADNLLDYDKADQKLLVYVPPERERRELSAAWDRTNGYDTPEQHAKIPEMANSFDKASSPFQRNETGISKGELTVTDGGRTA